MTPHRHESLAGYAIGSVKGLATVPLDTVGVVTAGVAAGVAWALGAENVALLWVVGLSMLLDLIVGAVSAAVDPLREFTIAKLYGGFIGKLFRALMIPAASLVDWLFIVSPIPLPEGYEAAFPVTALVMYGLAAAELTSAFSTFRDGGVSPSLISAVMRQLDRVKLGEEPPARRDYDKEALEIEREREEGGPS